MLYPPLFESRFLEFYLIFLQACAPFNPFTLMANSSSDTAGSCGDTPLAIASSVLAFYTAAIALLFTLRQVAYVLMRATSEMEDLYQEVLMLNLEVTAAAEALSIPQNSVEKARLPEDVTEMAEQVVQRSKRAVYDGAALLRRTAVRPRDLSAMKRLRWIGTSSAKAREVTTEAGRCRELLATWYIYLLDTLEDAPG